jgi:hypothetical protein
MRQLPDNPTQADLREYDEYKADLGEYALALVETIAGLTLDGECIEGITFVMTDDDNRATLTRLIHEARDIVGELEP